ncbi:very short patch repair endonuclease [Acidovorax sp. sic0104]|uniref:very short patch repair endonuclease n=1 Tax=Acidovorax sp. sic0104 TaxID=2854784 RepID=UPI001C460A29|nr:very short patch repair endonuclease [Acidovorax sp. sic0104]MBV7542840.1 very short patch repair endonuclease [Acidovorax sp. sic0104]
MDTVSPSVRSKIMQRVRGKNTRPELAVRSVAHALGLRFRLHDPKLPGRPDMVFAKHRTVIFVHGCFWHRHACAKATTPKSRAEFWQAKFEANKARDVAQRQRLEELGWRVLTIWECEVRDLRALTERLASAFGVSGSRLN